MNEWLPAIQGWFGPELHGTMVFVTDWAGPVGWLIAIQLVFILGGQQQGFKLALAVSIALITNTWLKWLIAEPRPFFLDPNFANAHGSSGFGMPSGHAQGAAATWGGIAALWWHRRWIAAAFILLALLTGLTRNYLGVHSPAQVIVGLALGALILAAVFTQWTRLCHWAQSLSWSRQWVYLALLVVACLLINQAILAWQSNFVVPELWLQNYASVTQSLGEQNAPSAAEFQSALFSNGAVILIAYFAGIISMAILSGRWPLAVLGVVGKWTLFAGALVTNVVYIYAGNTIYELLGSIAQPLSLVVFALLHPVICLFLPWQLVMRRGA